jgi:hypothetical protein
MTRRSFTDRVSRPFQAQRARNSRGWVCKSQVILRTCGFTPVNHRYRGGFVPLDSSAVLVEEEVSRFDGFDSGGEAGDGLFSVLDTFAIFVPWYIEDGDPL